MTDEFIALQDKIVEAAELYVGRELYAADIDFMMLNYPYLYKNIVVQADKLSFFTDETPSVDEMVALEVITEKNESVQFVSFAIGQALSTAKDMIWAYEHAFKFKEVTKSIQAQRATKRDGVGNIAARE